PPQRGRAMSVTDTQGVGGLRPNGTGLKDKAKAGGAAAKDKAGRASQALQDAARRGAEAARTQAAAAGRRMTQVAQARPMESLATTLAVGLLAGFAIGLFVGRASSD